MATSSDPLSVQLLDAALVDLDALIADTAAATSREQLIAGERLGVIGAALRDARRAAVDEHRRSAVAALEARATLSTERAMARARD